MAFDLKKIGGYGTGAKGNVTVTSTGLIVNSYAPVTSFNSTARSVVVNMNNAILSGEAPFEVGAEVLFHVSQANSNMGGYTVRTIESISGSGANTTLVFKAVQYRTYISNLATLSEVGNSCFPQVITIPNYRTLTINSGKSITAPAWDTNKKCGGIVALKCSEALTFKGGHINLADKGRTPSSTPNAADSSITQKETTAEANGKDSYKYAGWENYRTKDYLVLNGGDGAAFIVAKSFTGHINSRIGDTTGSGIARCRGAEDSDGANLTYSNIGGSSILIVAENITNNSNLDSTLFPEMISKYHKVGAQQRGSGMARCYIATESFLPQDEGLYAHDCISTTDRIQDECNVNNFGNGGLKSLTGSAATKQMNSYAKVTKISANKLTLTFNKNSLNNEGKAKFDDDQPLVMILAKGSVNTDETEAYHIGRFWITRIVSGGYKSNTIKIEDALPADFPDPLDGHILIQVIAIPEFTNFTLSGVNKDTPKVDASYGCGGVFAIAVAGACNLNSGTINVMGKGGASMYGEKGLKYLSNAAMSTRLPLGNGHGSVFILAKELTMNSSTRIGATYSGAGYGGGINAADQGWKGDDAVPPTANSPLHSYGTGGSGSSGGKDYMTDDSENPLGHNGGFGSSAVFRSADSGTKSADLKAVTVDDVVGGEQGAHILIVSQTITGLNQAAISTGGNRGLLYYDGSSTKVLDSTYGYAGGCGYGGHGTHIINSSNYGISGSGGHMGGGGGSGSKANAKGAYVNWLQAGGGAGFAFIYADEVVNQNTNNTVLS